MTVAKAVVLVTDRPGPEPWPNLGLSTRHLAPVANKPVLFHHLEGLTSAGIGETAIVCDRRSNAAVRDAVGDGSAWGLDIQYFEASPLESILTSRDVGGFIGSSPVLVQYGDVLLHEHLSALSDQFDGGALDALVVHAGRWSRPAPERARSIDGYLFGAGVYADLRRHTTRLRDAVVRLRAMGARIAERDVEACLPCQGGADALLATNRRLLETMTVDHVGERVFNSELHGRVAVDPSAEIHDSVIRGPVVIGPQARITHAYIGPYTSIGPGVIVDCAEIEHSIVLDGASICHIGGRLEASIVGRHARVFRDFSLPRALRLHVGDGVEVALC
jgi:glucose-1-phosphate thymidylyltransferase